MSWLGLEAYTQIWAVDFEFNGPPGAHPHPVCCAALELRSGQRLALWEEALQQTFQAPYALGADSLFLAFSAEAELGCHFALGWALPEHLVDLHAEFRALTNGIVSPKGAGLVEALRYCQLPCIEAEEKKVMRDLVLRGGPWTGEEQQQIMQYCASDVDSLQQLLAALLPHISLPHALYRGRYVKAVAHIEHRGIPLDCELRQQLADQWEAIQLSLVEAVNPLIGFAYEGVHFNESRFATWVAEHYPHWPLTPKKRTSVLDEETRKALVALYPELEPFHQLKKTLGKMCIANMVIGPDGRNRPGLQPFQTITGRNAPRTSENILGAAAWLRGLIQPEPGYGMAYIDWSQQEFGIAAVLSQDAAMLESYCSGDPYLRFGQLAGAIPPEGTKATHAAQRELYKMCVLGTSYGMSAATMARRAGHPLHVGERLRYDHQRTYRAYWRWVGGVIARARAEKQVTTLFGWPLHWTKRIVADAGSVSARTIQNFPCQGNGAEMMHIATCFAVESGVAVCASLHDAMLIEAPLAELDTAIACTVQAMNDASRAVLRGLVLRTEVQRFHYPQHYVDQRGVAMWSIVRPLLSHARV
jgi:hypothetical protein